MTELIKHCLPGEGHGDESWFNRLNAFEQQETKRQVVFKRNHWPDLENGVWSKRPDYQYPHILPENHLSKALYEPIAEEIIEYMKDKDIALHSEALNLRSSPICCFNVLFPLRKDKSITKVALKPLLPGVVTIDDVEFEYTGPAGTTEWLGEPPGGKRGQNRTSIDASIWWRDNDGKSCISLIEWKYTERSFGPCGGYESDANNAKGECRTLDAAHEYAGSKCFLTSGGLQTSRRYWELLAEAGIDRTKFKVLNGCPFRGPFYQLLRQSLLAEYLRQNNVDKVEVTVISFGQNTTLSLCPSYLKRLIPGSTSGSILDAWNAIMPGARPIRHVTIEEIMKATDQVLPRNDNWRSYVRERYGV